MLDRLAGARARQRAFVADAAHELRSPLANMRTELEVAQRIGDPPHVDGLLVDVERLTRLVDDLLLLARADDHHLALSLRGASAAELLDRARDRFGSQARGAGIELAVEVAPAVRVDVDGDRIAQALDNLVSNALRYARTEVALSARLDDGFVELHVTDDGEGFPADFLPGAFERFARADAARTEDGAGLGLAIVRTIAEAHGGTAEASNRSAGGGDVWISLPRS
jgi:signal transduction histidine kinase